MNFDSVSTVLNSHVFAIPDYQREYSWGDQENETLWSDLSMLFEDESHEHFLGAIVTVDYEDNDSTLLTRRPSEFSIDDRKVFFLLDGQQRITSVMLLLFALLDSVKNDKNLNDNERDILTVQIKKLLFVPRKQHGAEQAPRLFLKEQSGKMFCKEILHIACTGRVDKRYKCIKNMRGAIKLFSARIDEKKQVVLSNRKLAATAYDYYDKLLAAVLNQAYLVEIHCEKEMNEFQVFESLNGKGLNLTAVDRIRSIFMSKARQENLKGGQKWNAIESMLDEKWQIHFFVCLFFYLTGRRINKIALPERFRDFAFNSSRSFTSVDSELNDAASLYASLRNAESKNEKVKHTLEDIQAMGQEQVYVPLYAAARALGIDTDDFAAVARSLLVYMVRFTVCKRPSNIQDTVFSEFIDKVKNGQSASDLLHFVFERQEDDTSFQESFKSFSTNNSSIARYYMIEIERYLRKTRKGDESKIPDDISLEHVIPQHINYSSWYGVGNEPDDAVQDSFKEDVVNSIGNMALIAKPDNSKANNKNFSAKKKIYRTGADSKGDLSPYGTYLLIRDLVDNYNCFTENEVKSRAEEFSAYAVKIWPRQMS